jgi:hypothetical protein
MLIRFILFFAFKNTNKNVTVPNDKPLPENVSAISTIPHHESRVK